MWQVTNNAMRLVCEMLMSSPEAHLSSMFRGRIAQLGPGSDTSQNGGNPEHGEGLTEGISGGVRHGNATCLAVDFDVLLLRRNACRQPVGCSYQ